MSTTRPETTDNTGTTHRYGCAEPGWTATPSSVRGWNIARCDDCGTVRLERTTTTQEMTR